MERYVHGEAPAFDELFARYENRAFAYFARRTGSPDRAQDLYQELFLRVHRARHAYDARRPFAPWFFQIAHRLLIDDQRRAFRSHELPLDEQSLASPHPRGAEGVADREQLARLLGALSPDERFVLLARAARGVAHAELATQLGKSTDAVKKMASRTLQRLRRLALEGTRPHSL